MNIKLLSLILLSVLLGNCNNEHANDSNINQEPLKVDTSGKISSYHNGYEFLSREAEELNFTALEKIRNNEIDKALEYLLQAKEIENHNPAIISNIGLVFQRKGEYDKAIDYMKNAISYSDSSYIPAVINLSNIYLDIDKHNESKRLSTWALSKSKDLRNQAGIYLNLILANVNLGQCENAKSNLIQIEKIAKTTNQVQLIRAGKQALKKCIE